MHADDDKLEKLIKHAAQPDAYIAHSKCNHTTVCTLSSTQTAAPLIGASKPRIVRVPTIRREPNQSINVVDAFDPSHANFDAIRRTALTPMRPEICTTHRRFYARTHEYAFKRNTKNSFKIHRATPGDKPASHGAEQKAARLVSEHRPLKRLGRAVMRTDGCGASEISRQ